MKCVVIAEKTDGFFLKITCIILQLFASKCDVSIDNRKRIQ